MSYFQVKISEEEYKQIIEDLKKIRPEIKYEKYRDIIIYNGPYGTLIKGKK